MGDRRNVIVKQDDRGVALYTHWHGTQLPEIVRAAMIRGRNRWTDSAYLARIIFSEMIKDAVMDEIGYGISSATNRCEPSDRDMVVDCETQTVKISMAAPPVSFAQFCNGKGG